VVVLIVLALILLILVFPLIFSIDGCLDFINLSIYGKVKFVLPFSFEVLLVNKKKNGNFKLTKQKLKEVLNKVEIKKIYTHLICPVESYLTLFPTIFTTLSNKLTQLLLEKRNVVYIHSLEIAKNSDYNLYLYLEFRSSLLNLIIILFCLFTNNSKKEQKERVWKKKKTQS